MAGFGWQHGAAVLQTPARRHPGRPDRHHRGIKVDRLTRCSPLRRWSQIFTQRAPRSSRTTAKFNTHELDGAADPQCAVVLAPFERGGNRRTESAGQNAASKKEGDVDGRETCRSAN